MEALDVLYAKKHLKALTRWAASGESYADYDDERRDYRMDNNVNGYSVLDISPQIQSVQTVVTSVTSGKVNGSADASSIGTSY